jgi:hypothetical protein
LTPDVYRAIPETFEVTLKEKNKMYSLPLRISGAFITHCFLPPSLKAQAGLCCYILQSRVTADSRGKRGSEHSKLRI